MTDSSSSVRHTPLIHVSLCALFVFLLSPTILYPDKFKELEKKNHPPPPKRRRTADSSDEEESEEEESEDEAPPPKRYVFNKGGENDCLNKCVVWSLVMCNYAAS